MAQYKPKKKVRKQITQPIARAVPAPVRQNQPLTLILAIILLAVGIYLILESSTKLQTTAVYTIKAPIRIPAVGIELGETKILDVEWRQKEVNRPYGILDWLIGGVKELTKTDLKVKLVALQNGYEIASKTQIIRATGLEYYQGEISVEVPRNAECTYVLEIYSKDDRLLDSKTK